MRVSMGMGIGISMGMAECLDKVLGLGQLRALVAWIVVDLVKVLGDVGIKLRGELVNDILVPVFKFDALACDGHDGSHREKS